MTAQFYVVGGAVRDALLGLPESDRDWVVVGATPQQLLDLGYKPVGKDFPVFLHPQTHEEVALARTERKTGPGYRGFSFHAAPDVTLQDDLARRDLTINAIARTENGTLIDPHGGQHDLRARVLRHVSEAFVEDPVRLLRLARLAARFPDFTVAPETMALLRRMVAAGEVDALVPERVWQELQRGLMTATPQRMVEVLRDCGALARLLPALDARWDTQQARVLACSAQLQAPLPVRWACLMHGVVHGLVQGLMQSPGDATAVHALGLRLRVSADCLALADLLAREWVSVQGSATLGAPALMDLFERCDALRRPDRFAALLQACACVACAACLAPADSGPGADPPPPYPPQHRLPPLLQAAATLDTATLAAQAASSGKAGPAIGACIRDARIAAIQAALHHAPAASGFFSLGHCSAE